MIHQEHNHNWNGSVMYPFVFVCLCASVCDVRLHVYSGGVLSLLSRTLSLFSFHCVSASDHHMCENKPQHMYVLSHIVCE